MNIGGKILVAPIFVVALLATACQALLPTPQQVTLTTPGTLSTSVALAATSAPTSGPAEARCDVVCQDATAAARITPALSVTNSPLYYEHERQYRERLEATRTALAAATPTPADTPTLAPATSSATPVIEVYQGPSYASRTQPPEQFQVRYTTADWTREGSNLHHRRLAGCTLLLMGRAREAAGPVQTTFIPLGGYSWRRLVDHAGHAIYYSLDFGDSYYLIEADLPGDVQSSDSMECQRGVEAVLATFRRVNN